MELAGSDGTEVSSSSDIVSDTAPDPKRPAQEDSAASQELVFEGSCHSRGIGWPLFGDRGRLGPWLSEAWLGEERGAGRKERGHLGGGQSDLEVGSPSSAQK